MINRLLKGIVDLVFAVGLVKSKFLNDHPAERILAADGAKGIITKGDQEIERGIDWVDSQRAVILLTHKRIRCGTWDIPLTNIEAARLLKISSLYGPGLVLKVKTRDNQHYQFGMQFNPEWTTQTALPLTLEQGTVKTSTFSLIIRLLGVGSVIYWLLNRFEIL